MVLPAYLRHWRVGAIANIGGIIMERRLIEVTKGLIAVCGGVCVFEGDGVTVDAVRCGGFVDGL